MTGVLATVVATGLVAAMFYWQRVLRSWHGRTALLLWLSLLFLMMAVALQITPIYRRTAHVAGWNVFWPLQWALVIACCLMLHIFAIRAAVTTQDKDRQATCRITRLTLVIGLTFALAFVLFLTAPDDPDFMLGPNSRLAIPGRVSVPVGLSWVLVQIIIGASCLSHTFRALRWANRSTRANRTWLRAGMRIFGAGFAVGAAYSIHSAIYQASETVGWIPSWPQQSVTNPLITAAPVLMFIGLVLPAIGSWQRERSEGSALLRRLEPLQRLLPHGRNGNLSFFRRVRQSWLRLWRPTMLVYESMIGLEDAYLLVRHQVPDSVSEYVTQAARQAGLDDDTQGAVVLAATVATWFVLGRDEDHADMDARVAGEQVAGALLGNLTRDANTARQPQEQEGQAAQGIPHKLAMISDLDRWLRASDVLCAARTQLDGHLQQPAEHCGAAPDGLPGRS